MTETDLKNQIKEGVFQSLYLIHGDESFAAEHYARQIAKKSVPEAFAAFNYLELDGGRLNLDELYVFAENYPMMSDKKCVLIKDTDPEAMNAADTKKLNDILSEPNEACIIVFVNRSVTVKKSAKWKSFLKLIECNGSAVEIKKRDTATLIKKLCVNAQKQDSKISPDTARYLIERSGDRLNILINELGKLCAYKNGGEITKADVDLLASRTLDASVFDISKAISRGDAAGAYSVLADLMYQKEEPVAILSVMSMSFIDMYRAKAATAGGERADIVAKHFEYKGREFRLRNGARDAGSRSLKQLRECIDVLARADRKLKSERVEGRFVLEEVIAKLTAAR